ncbi:MAG: phospholipid carrier-dependent glycosyltransferase [Deltaproteobacteria bacterium]|nr:phospholipid carrier-dependent glycosyltransferase [Deltaproteobacteria bacterium]
MSKFLTSKYVLYIALLVILASGAALRFFGIRHGISFHPDERHIIGVAERLSLQDPNPHFFAYGSFPFYLLWGVSELLGIFSEWAVSYDGLYLVGRLISVLFGVLAGLLTYLVAARTSAGAFAALSAAAFLMLNPFHIQLSRFYAFDGVLTTVSLAAILSILRLLDSKASWVAYLTAGAAIGVAVATKISALSLFLPAGIAVMLIYLRDRQFKKLAGLSLVLVFTTVAVFTLVEPYAWLDWQTFIANNREQIAMVRGDSRPPYTVQYVGTAPYIYPLQQMFSYTIGWPLMLLAGTGIAISIVGQFKKINAPQIVLLVWALPTFFIISGYQVKFPRYLLPIYPIILIFASIALRRLLSYAAALPHLRRVLVPGILLFVFGYAAVRAFAHVSIYTTDHSYEQASRYMFENIPAGAKIMHGHWDDTLPLHLPGLDPRRYQREGKDFELPLYEAEQPWKINVISERTAAADYIVFPTPRLYGSIPRIPDELPLTTAYFQLLFSGHLGFDLQYAFKVQPQFGPFNFNNDLADESLYVYDHPKVVIFRNRLRLPPEEISRRMHNPAGFGALPSREEMLLVSAGTPQESAASVASGSSFPSLLAWVVVVQLMGMIVFPLFIKVFSTYSDKGYAFSKPLGMIVFGYLAWLIPSLGLAPATQVTYLYILALLLLLSFGLVADAEWWRKYFVANRRQVVITELLFWSCFLLFLIIRAFNPEIFWGEKPMDLTFLNFFIRSDSLPPQDPWAAGNNMRYYYLGSYIIAAMLECVSIPAAIGYNLAMATLPALCLVSIFGLILFLTRRKWLAIIGACAAVLASNIEIHRLVFVEGKTLNFDSFWAATRLLTPPGFTEFPLWSFLFADLHAHVIALPFTALLLGLSARLVTRRSPALADVEWYHRALYAMVLGCLMALNAWDFIVYGILTGIMLFAGVIRAMRPNSWSAFFRVTLRSAAEFSIIVGAAHIFILPYLIYTQPAQSASWGWNHVFEYNKFQALFMHFGTWFSVIAAGILVVAARCLLKRQPVVTYLLPLTAASIPLLLGGACIASGLAIAPWDILALSSVLILGSTLLLMLRGRDSDALTFASLSVAAAALIIAFAEVFFIIDRTNTIFKFYCSLWFLLAAAAGVLLGEIFPRNFATRLRDPKKYPLLGVQLVCVIFLVAGAVGSIMNIAVTVRFQRIDGPRPTLNGAAYLRGLNADEAAMIDWLNSNVKGAAVMLEAQKDSYGAYSRITMHTGIPIILAWEHHVKQRGTPEQSVTQRRHDIRVIYSTSNVGMAERLLNRYGVNLIVIGKLERATYPPEGIDKFIRHPEHFPVLFESNETYLLTTRNSLMAQPGYSPLILRWR